MDRKYVPLSGFKALTDGAGGFEGYASKFGVRDDGGDIVMRGAYLDTLEQFVKNGFIARAHDWDALPIGTIAEAQEDDIGLYIRVEYHSTPEAQAARTVTMERIAAGKSVGLSIGYEVNPDGFEQTPTARLLKSLKLYEVSVVTVPMLRSAGVTAVKEHAPVEAKAPAPEQKWYGPIDLPGTYEDLIEELNRAIREMVDTPWGDTYACVMATYPGSCIVQLWSDDECTYWQLPYAVDADGDPVLGTPLEVTLSFMPVPTAAGEPGISYSAHAGRTLAVVKGFVERSQIRLEKRAKEGRVLSTVNRGTLAELRDAAKTILDQIENMLDATDPEREKAPDADALYLEFQRIVARQNGVAA